MLETDLSAPVKSYLEGHGYQVNCEVKNCDIVATKDGDVIVVELKTSINLTLIVQATNRQTFSDSVYVAVPAPNKKSRHWRGVITVLKRLELGLLLVETNPLYNRREVRVMAKRADDWPNYVGRAHRGPL